MCGLGLEMSVTPGWLGGLGPETHNVGSGFKLYIIDILIE